jgi:S1-C subfamily serine protease
MAGACVAVALASATVGAQPSGLPEVIATVKLSIVGVGTMSYARRPAGNLMGSGFVVADGRHVVTNAHVVPDRFADAEEFVAVFVREGRRILALRSQLVERDTRHDLALIRFEGEPLTALELAEDGSVREGELLAFTGYPKETLYGMQATTHRGIVSSIVDIPNDESNDGSSSDEGGDVGSTHQMFQLDATAFPGNSGSPLYRPENGEVVGIVSRISAESQGQHGRVSPGGVAYAVPTSYVHDLLDRAGVSQQPRR